MPVSNVRVSAAIGANITTAPALGSTAGDIKPEYAALLAAGVGAGQADRVYSAQFTINASSTQTLDLAGALVSSDGSAFTPAKVKAIFVKNTHATQPVVLSRPASNGVPLLLAAGNGVLIPAGGCVLLVAPGLAGLAAVTAGTGDLVDLVNGAGSSVTVDVVIVGTSA